MDLLEVPVQSETDISPDIVRVVACAVRVLLVLGVEEVINTEGETERLPLRHLLRHTSLEPEEMVGWRTLGEVGSRVKATLTIYEAVRERELPRVRRAQGPT